VLLDIFYTQNFNAMFPQEYKTLNLSTYNEGLGSWFKKAVSNVGKFIQQTDLVSHAASELGVGKTTVGKILVPTASDNIDKYQTIVKKDMPKPVLQTVDAVNCAKSEFKNDARCIEFIASQAVVQQSQQIIDTPVVKTFDLKNKTTLIVGGAIGLSLILIIVASTSGKKKATKSE
jgi:hypothetical protein